MLLYGTPLGRLKVQVQSSNKNRKVVFGSDPPQPCLVLLLSGRAIALHPGVGRVLFLGYRTRRLVDRLEPGSGRRPEFMDHHGRRYSTLFSKVTPPECLLQQKS